MEQEQSSLELIVKKWLEIARYDKTLKFELEIADDMMRMKNDLDILLEGLGKDKKDTIKKDHLKFQDMRIDEYSKVMKEKSKNDK